MPAVPSPAVSARVVRFHQHGEPRDVLHEERVEVAGPAAGRVRVRVVATGLNPADWEVCRGFLPGTLPQGIGFDVAGTIDAIGEGVDGVAPGDLVFGVAEVSGQPSSGAADFAILSHWFPIPAGLDPVQAATLPMVAQTVAWTLEVMQIAAGTTLLVHGAGGMVGYLAVQVALRQGARVIATAGPTFAADLEGFGAQVTSYGDGMADRVRELAGGDVDLVLDTPRPSPGTLPTLIALAGGDPRRVVTISNHAEARELGARVNIDELTTDLTPIDVVLPSYAALMAAGQLRLPIAKVFALGDWRAAMELSLSGRPHGKIVLQPGADAS